MRKYEAPNWDAMRVDDEMDEPLIWDDKLKLATIETCLRLGFIDDAAKLQAAWFPLVSPAHEARR